MRNIATSTLKTHIEYNSVGECIQNSTLKLWVCDFLLILNLTWQI